MCDRMAARTDEYLSLINWRNNGQPRDLNHAVELAKLGIDGGREATMRLRPTSRVFEEWINWSNLTTYLLNRDTDYQQMLSTMMNDDFPN